MAQQNAINDTAGDLTPKTTQSSDVGVQNIPEDKPADEQSGNAASEQKKTEKNDAAVLPADNDIFIKNRLLTHRKTL